MRRLFCQPRRCYRKIWMIILVIFISSSLLILLLELTRWLSECRKVEVFPCVINISHVTIIGYTHSKTSENWFCLLSGSDGSSYSYWHKQTGLAQNPKDCWILLLPEINIHLLKYTAQGAVRRLFCQPEGVEKMNDHSYYFHIIIIIIIIIS